MLKSSAYGRALIFFLTCLILGGCAASQRQQTAYYPSRSATRLPQHLVPCGKKVILINPRIHAWAAYGRNGNRVHSGVTLAGADCCHNLDQTCSSPPGTYRMIPQRGAYQAYIDGVLMTACLCFSPSLCASSRAVDDNNNLSHGCLRLPIQDVQWLRLHFLTNATPIIILAD